MSIFAHDARFFDLRRRQIRQRHLRFPVEALSMIEPTGEMVKKYGMLRAEYEDGIFLSHTHADGEFIKNNIMPSLRLRGPCFFTNVTTPASDTYVRFVGHALLACDSAFVTLSKDVLQSTWVPKEIDLILARRRMPVVFLVLDAVNPVAIHPDLKNRRRLLSWRKPHKIFWLNKSPTALRDAVDAAIAISARAHRMA